MNPKAIMVPIEYFDEVAPSLTGNESKVFLHAFRHFAHTDFLLNPQETLPLSILMSCRLPRQEILACLKTLSEKRLLLVEWQEMGISLGCAARPLWSQSYNLQAHDDVSSDTRLSAETRATFWYLLSLPDPSDIEPTEIAKCLELSLDTVRNHYEELARFGYLLRAGEVCHRGDETWSGYHIFDFPFFEEEK